MAITHGHVTVASAGTAVQFPGPATTTTGNNWAIIAHPDNTGVIFLGNSGVDSTNGSPLSGGMGIVYNFVSLEELWADAATSADVVTWMRTG